MPAHQSFGENNSNTLSYIHAKARLEATLRAELAPNPTHQKARALLEQVERLREQGKQPIVELTKVIEDTDSLLTHNLSVADYRAQAQKVQGSPSLGMKLLGGLMIGLALLVGAACAALAYVGITLSGESLLGAGALAAGVGLFSTGLRSGLSLAMNEVADEYEKTPRMN